MVGLACLVWVGQKNKPPDRADMAIALKNYIWRICSVPIVQIEKYIF